MGALAEKYCFHNVELEAEGEFQRFEFLNYLKKFFFAVDPYEKVISEAQKSFQLLQPVKIWAAL